MTGPEDETAVRLSGHVRMLAERIGPRHLGRPEALNDARRYIEEQLTSAGYEVRAQEFDALGYTVANVEAELAGRRDPARIVLLGAHYDTVPGSPGADDNGSGVAALIELARLARSNAYQRTVRFVAFVNEEPPWFQTERMGSVVYASRSKTRGELISAMLALESVGYYSDAPGSQTYPPPFHLFFPNVGNFVAAVSNFASWGMLRDVVGAFRRGSTLPIIGSPAPTAITGVGWSDHWAFWRAGYPAMMLTGTAPFRNPHYHTAADRSDTVDYARLAQVVAGIDAALEALARLQ